MIVALGETIVTTGDRITEVAHWTSPALAAFGIAFLASLAAWWIYFGTSSEDGSRAITRSSDPGRVGAYFHYVHVILIAGIIVMAAANNLILSRPDGAMDLALTATLVSGPAIYLLGSSLYRRVVYGGWSPAHGSGIVALAAIASSASHGDRLIVGGATTLVLLVVGATKASSDQTHGGKAGQARRSDAIS